MKKLLILSLIILGVVSCSKEINEESLKTAFKDNGLPTVSIEPQPIPSEYQDKLKAMYKIVINAGGWKGQVPVVFLQCEGSVCEDHLKELKAGIVAAEQQQLQMFGNYARKLNGPQEPYLKLTNSKQGIIFMPTITNQRFPENLRKNLENVAEDL